MNTIKQGVTETKRLGISFGALSDPIRKQLKAQGFKFEVKEVTHFEKQLDAITRLKFASLISDKVAKSAMDKLFKKIERHIIKVNKLNKI